MIAHFAFIGVRNCRPHLPARRTRQPRGLRRLVGGITPRCRKLYSYVSRLNFIQVKTQNTQHTPSVPYYTVKSQDKPGGKFRVVQNWVRKFLVEEIYQRICELVPSRCSSIFSEYSQQQPCSQRQLIGSARLMSGWLYLSVTFVTNWLLSIESFVLESMLQFNL